MATFRKRNGKWQAIVRHKDIGTKAKTFQTKTAAIRWSADQERRLENETFGKLLPEEATLEQLLRRYMSEIVPLKRSPDAEIRRLKRLLKDPISSASIKKLTPRMLADFRDKRLVDGLRACQYDLVIIRHCLKLSIYEWGLLLDHNPADRIRLPPSPKPRQRRLLEGELERLQKASLQTRNINVWPVIVFAIETGMRRGEILRLTWEDINFSSYTARLRQTKNGHERVVPLSSQAISVLDQQKKGSTKTPFPINDNSFRLAWDRLKRRAGITDLKFHDLRHEAISRLFEKGLNIAEVAMISGHKDPR
ncbi:MAG: site-specific integrase, partial [Candidatus Micropelagos thuwalensis]